MWTSELNNTTWTSNRNHRPTSINSKLHYWNPRTKILTYSKGKRSAIMGYNQRSWHQKASAHPKTNNSRRVKLSVPQIWIIFSKSLPSKTRLNLSLHSKNQNKSKQKTGLTRNSPPLSLWEVPSTNSANKIFILEKDWVRENSEMYSSPSTRISGSCVPWRSSPRK